MFPDRQSGRLISKEELIDSVRKGRVVSDTMPGGSIAELRQALADSARPPRYIETGHGRGFRFIAEIWVLPNHGPPRGADPHPAVRGGGISNNCDRATE